jgi:hypothetical protein
VKEDLIDFPSIFEALGFTAIRDKRADGARDKWEVWLLVIL